MVKKIHALRLRDFYTKYLNRFKKLGGNNVVVEIDESKIGKNKHHRGKSVKGFWCFGMVEKTPKRRIIFILISKRDYYTLMPLILIYINQDSIVYSDMWKVYHKLNIYFQDHFMVNHSKNFVDKLTGIHTNTIEGNWRSLKYLIPNRCRTKRLSPLYLIRYMIRRNESG